MQNLKRKTVDDANNKYTSIFNKLKFILKYITVANDVTEDVLNHASVEQIKSSETFDLIVFGWFMNDFQYGLAAHFKCPYVLVSASIAMPSHRQLVGNPTGFPYHPSGFMSTVGHMTYLQRLQNFGIHLVEICVTLYADFFLTPFYYERSFPIAKQYPLHSEVAKNVSLVLISQHFTQNGPRLSFPNLIEVSGMHIKEKSDPLPDVSMIWI